MTWLAQWVWLEHERLENRYMMARRSFMLSGPVRACSLAISADSHYKLYVNGTFIRRGPVRRIAGHFYYDRIDVAQHLHPGNNVIAILAHQRFRRQGKLLVQGHVEIEGNGSIELNTGAASWRITPARAWNRDVRAATSGPEVGYQEVLDLRQLPENWLEADFDDSAWSTPVIVGDAAQDAAAGNLSLRDIPPLSEQLISETPAILRACSMTSLPDAYGVDLEKAPGATEYLGCRLVATRDTTLEFTGVGDGNLAVFLDGVCLSFRAKDTGEKAQALILRLGRGGHVLALRLGKGIWTWTTTYSVTANASVQFSPDGREFSGNLDRWQALRNLDETRAWPEPGHVVEDLPTESNYPSGDAVQVIKARLNVAQRMTWEQIIKDLPTPSAFPLEIPSQTPGQTTAVVFDLGKECVGFPVLELACGEEGAVLDIGYGEFLADGLVSASHYVNHFADRVTLRRGHQIFEPSFWWKGCRYLQIQFRNADAPLTLHHLRFRECRYPAEPVGRFECNDPVLNEIWRMGIRTLQCCMGDAYMDCPSREQKDYLGDGIPQIHANYYTLGDTLLAANLLRQYGRRQEPSGFFGEGPRNILDQNLDYVIILRLCYLFTGNRELLHEFYEPSRELIQAFTRHLNSDGLLQNLSGSCWVDHELWDFHDADRTGVRTRLDLRFYQALRDMAYVAAETGHEADAREFQLIADRVRDGIRRLLWDPERHLYIDGIKDGKPLSGVSLHVNYLAILYEVAPRDQWDAMFQAMTNPGLHAAREFSPFFHYYVHRALFKMEKPEGVLDYLREIWGGFLRSGLTTFPEGLKPAFDSRCHAYSCTPNVDLAADILGVFPLEPGFRLFAVRPRIDLLTEASASLPTPHGDIRIAWNSVGEFLDFSLTIPPGTQALLSLRGADRNLAAGNHHWRLGRDRLLPTQPSHAS